MTTKLKVPRGATFRKGWVWYAGEETIKTVQSAVRGFPTILNCTAHGLPSFDIPVSLLDLGALNTLNDDGVPSFDSKYRVRAHKIDADTFSVAIDSTEFDDAGPGYAVFLPPQNLTGYTARMQFRETIDDVALLLELTQAAGIELGGPEGSIDILLTDAQTTAFTVDSIVWNIELIAPGVNGDVTRFDEGTLELSPDVNRPVI